MRQLAIRLSIAGFAIHLLLILLARTLAHPPQLIAEAGQNYLTAISTPFNFILFLRSPGTHCGAADLDNALDCESIRDRVADLYPRCFPGHWQGRDLVIGHKLTLESLPLFMDMWADS